MHFESQPGPGSPTGWQGRGDACLTGEADADGYRLHEAGRFQPAGSSRSLAFRNTYAWRRYPDRLALAHERFGRDTPVPLVDLVADSRDCLVGRAPHRCGADRYSARLTLVADGFDLVWLIVGPAKQENLCYHYRATAR